MSEIERKWLVDRDKCPGLVSPHTSIFRTIQGYLNSTDDNWLIRVRKFEHRGSIGDVDLKYETRYYLELKTHGLLSREELRYIITEDEFEETLDKCNGSVKKTRYCWNEEGIYYEVDVYDDHDFVTCEVEFKSEEEANEFIAPEWCIKDVTLDPAYKNVNLVV